ncbi:MAG: ferritin-like domain-containing protein [Alphaproteobacteria bacterium]|nr:ferritin-like domain-containing protein [Alphaproteobacteria bacterium]
MGHWGLDTIPWASFDPGRVDPGLIPVIKAAALVEGNAADYVRYLRAVFRADPDFVAAAERWGEEERQHGAALARWAMLADPAFDFEAALARFRTAYRMPVDAGASVRGSEAGELIARCIVECGTSSFYSAIRDATEEPCLKALAAHIAGDEFRHYKLFQDNLERCLRKQPMGRWRRLAVALGRIGEVQDDELASAYWSANAADQTYDRVRHARAYEAGAWRLYRYGHVRRALGMTLRACGFSAQGHLPDRLAYWAHRYMVRRAAKARARLAPPFSGAGR